MEVGREAHAGGCMPIGSLAGAVKAGQMIDL